MGINAVPTKKQVEKYLFQLVGEITDSELRLLEIQIEHYEDVPLEYHGVVQHRLSGEKTLKISWVPKPKKVRQNDKS